MINPRTRGQAPSVQPRDRPPTLTTLKRSEPDSSVETAYVREDGYPARYRDIRFTTGSGRRTDRRERRAIERLLRRCAVRPGPWLDAPSGAGRMSDLLPAEVVQVDRDRGMVAGIRVPGALRVCASVHALPFADATFAGALCHRLLHHLPGRAERVRVLSELRRVTDGPILLSFFHSGSLQHVRRLLSRGVRRKPISGRCAVSLRVFLADLAAAGLRVRDCAPLAPFVSEQWILRVDRTDAPPMPDGLRSARR